MRTGTTLKLDQTLHYSDFHKKKKKIITDFGGKSHLDSSSKISHFIWLLHVVLKALIANPLG